MHRQPFSLMQIQVTTTEGISIWKPMWSIIMGQRRDQLSSIEADRAYRQRYDIEHLLRFGRGFPVNSSIDCSSKISLVVNALPLILFLFVWAMEQ